MPVDPVSGGTWIACTDAGLVLCLLNTNPGLQDPAAAQAPRSRGEIVPLLLASESLDEVVDARAQIDARSYAPFRVLAARDNEFAVLEPDGASICVARRGKLERPFMLTSSGLGDRVVEPPRRALFDEMFGESDDWGSAQDAFHDHAWPRLAQSSVLMSRPDARTVSRTVVDVWRDRTIMTYQPIGDAPSTAGLAVSVTLAIGPIRATA